MLSEKEKKAIERLEEQLDFWKKQNVKNSDCEIILSFITKLQKESKEKDRKIKTLNNTNKSYKGIINKQNKQINLMAEKIFKEGIIWENKEEEMTIGEMCEEYKKVNEELQIKLKNKQSEIDFLKGKIAVYEKFLNLEDLNNE